MGLEGILFVDAGAHVPASTSFFCKHEAICNTCTVNHFSKGKT